VRFVDLDKENLILVATDGNNFVKKFINKTFVDDYDIGKSSVYRSQEDIDNDAVKIINEMKEYDESGFDRTGEENIQKINYYEDVIKNPSRTSFNYDFKGGQN
jgi:hypothetical protein